MALRKKSGYLPTFHKTLSLPVLLKNVRKQFDKIPQAKVSGSVKTPKISLSDVLLSGLAIFNFKFPSLLQYDKQRNEPKIRANLIQLFGIKHTICDTQMRVRLDDLPPSLLRPAVTTLHKSLQKNRVLEKFHYLDKQLLFSVDGTTYFQSDKVSCPCCNKKKKKNGIIEYSHQALVCSIVHPDQKQVFPFFHEDIHKKKGETKNDCEQNAAKRFLPELKKVYPDQKITILEDSLFSTAPHLKLLESLNFNYIIAAKPGNHSFLFSEYSQANADHETEEFEWTKEEGTLMGYRFINDLPLNYSNQNIRVNFIEHWEIPSKGPYKGKRKIFTYITNHLITFSTVIELSKAGRTRSKIENETFNTLKNQGYQFEHNYGHGHQHLSSVFVSLMLMMFLMDQIQESCCEVFNLAYKKAQSRITLWEKMRGLFLEFYILKWEDIYLSIAYGHQAKMLKPDFINTS